MRLARSMCSTELPPTSVYPDLGFGRIVVSEIEALNLLVSLV